MNFSCLRRPLLTLSALLALAVALPSQFTLAQPAARAERPAQQRTDDGQSNGLGVLRLLPADAVSDKEGTVADRTIAYTATAGTLPLFDQNGERTAAVFYTAYVLEDFANPSATPRNISADAARNTAANDNTARPDRSSRPVTFAFNGGPGAASAYLHLGLVGPRLAEFRPHGREGPPQKAATTIRRPGCNSPTW